MPIPSCYDPPTQELHYQTALDRFVEDLPACDNCGSSVYPADIYFPEVDIGKHRFCLCARCESVIHDSGVALEM